MDIKKTLKISRTTYGSGNYDAIRLNMPVCGIFKAIGATNWDFFDILETLGFSIDAPIMASDRDVADYLRIPKSDDPLGIKECEYDDSEYSNGLVNILCNLVYYDEPFRDETTGLCGLKDTNGKITVPAMFAECDGCHDMLDIDSLALVSKANGSMFLTPRDGSGRLINRRPYTEIKKSCSWGWTHRKDKVGLIDIKTGDTLIPCTMDWLHTGPLGVDFTFGKDGKIGFYDAVLKCYSRPRYTAYDFTTHSFCRDGVWGWILRKENRFVTRVPASYYDIHTPGIDLTSFLDYDDRPKDPDEKEYYTCEEVFDNIEKRGNELQQQLDRPFAEQIRIPELEIPEYVKPGDSLVNNLSGFLEDTNPTAAIALSIDDPMAPEMTIRHFGNRDTVLVEWSPVCKATAWMDVSFPLLKCCHQLLECGKRDYRLRFVREFGKEEFEAIAKFVTYYFQNVWDNDRIVCKSLEFVP